MIFLIEYDRRKGRIVTLRAFGDAKRASAENERLELELKLNRKKLGHEVVLLEALSEETVRRTHRRYFEGSREIAQGASGNIKRR